jgi:hypothetical protein
MFATFNWIGGRCENVISGNLSLGAGELQPAQSIAAKMAAKGSLFSILGC